MGLAEYAKSFDDADLCTKEDLQAPMITSKELEEKEPTAANQVERKVQSPLNKILNFKHTLKEDFKNLKQINKEVRKQGIEFKD